MESRQTTKVWKALADPTRRRILDLLRDTPRTTGQIAGEFQVSRIAVMKHLRTLCEAGLVVDRKRGRERWHYLNSVPLQDIHERWFEPHRARWSSSLLGLRDAVERRERPDQRGAAMGETASGPQLAMDFALEVTIEGDVERVFDALTRDVACWWGPPFVADEATGLVLEPRLGGRFYEDWGDGAGAVLAEVSVIRRPTRLELTGRFHYGLVQAVADFRLDTRDHRTVVALSHQAVGALTRDPRLFQTGWGELLGRLESYVERGEIHGIAGLSR